MSKFQTVARIAPAARPNCACCAKPLPIITTWKHFDPGTEPACLADAQRLVNGQIMRVRWGNAERHLTEQEVADWNAAHPRSALASTDHRTQDTSRGKVITTVHYWDGESYGVRGYGPFCSLRCGLDFGKAAHRAGYRIKEA